MKWIPLHQGEIIAKERKEKILKKVLKSSPEPAYQYQSNLVHIILG
jgi:hypothetical protein